MMHKEPIRHHYIPQFILRNFCFDENKKYLHYFDKKTSQLYKRKIEETFMVRNLYRDNINNPDEPTKIEKDLARFESEVSKIITDRFLKEDEISITYEEDDKLKLFFAIMAFRSKITSNKFGIEASDESKRFYSMYQTDGNLSDFWKRNLGYLANCRSLREVLNHKEIDMPIKIFFRRDTFGFFGLYFIVAERRGPFEFIISDVYPTVITGVTDYGFENHLYSIYPISPDRVILIASNGIDACPKSVAVFSDEVLKKPKVNRENKLLIRVKKIYENDVKYINSVQIKEAYDGFAFKDRNKITLLS
ncbi:MAG: DUF4238 domain-containing protein [Butyrivibrio sp.]|nr:DUF4238 domain-containing protein [Butyrivibrio sp.]